jgi:hypothetical protein
MSATFTLVGALAALALVACGGDQDGNGRLEATSRASILPSVPPSNFTDAVMRVPNGGDYRADGIRYRARSVVPQDLEPPQVSATVRLTNESAESRHLPIKGCTVLLRVYKTAARNGTPAFFEAGQPGWQCAQASTEIYLAPGESRDLSTAVDVYQILDDANPEGHYYFSAIVRRQDHSLELPAGDAQLSYGLGALRYRGDTRLVDGGRMLDVEVVAVNRGKRPTHVEYGACAVRLRVYRSKSRTEAPVWDSSERPNPDPRTGVETACPLYSAATTLAPGDSLTPREFAESIPVDAILGDSLPPGRYYFSASARINHHFARDVGAGEADLHVRAR